MDRAYSTVEIRSISEGEGVVTGVASTPSVDLMSDIVLTGPQNIKARLPLPWLWQHDSERPIGHIEWLNPTANALHFRARMAKVDEPGPLRERLREAWLALKSKLVSGISIGFLPLKWEPLQSGGRRFTEIQLTEISSVTVPANMDASIATIKRLDQAALARSARPSRFPIVRLNDPASSARKPSRVVRLAEPVPAPRIAKGPGAVGTAILQANEKAAAHAKREAERRKLGPANALMIDLLAAGAKATDAELAALRVRLEKLERGR